MSGASITAGTIAVTGITGSAVNLNTTQTITATKTFSVAQTFSNNIRLDGSFLLNAGDLTLTNAQLQAIPTTTTKCTNISYANVGGLQSTTITNSLISQVFYYNY
jgi:hypothetical protein